MAITLTARGSVNNKSSQDPFAVGLSGSIAVGNLIVLAVAYDEGTFSYISVSDDASSSKNVYIKVGDLASSGHGRVSIWMAVCNTALTASNTINVDWGGGSPGTAMAAQIYSLTPHNAGRGWRFGREFEDVNSVDRNWDFGTITGPAGFDVNTNVLFVAVGFEWNTTGFTVASGMTAGNSAGTSGTPAASNQRVFTGWRSMAASTGYTINGTTGTVDADNYAVAVELINECYFWVGTFVLNVYMSPGAQATASVRLRSSFTSSPLATCTIGSGFRLRSSMTSSPRATPTASVRLRSTLQATSTGTATIGSYQLTGGSTHADCLSSPRATATIGGATLRSSLASAATGAGTATARIASTLRSSAAGSGTAAVRLRAVFPTVGIAVPVVRGHSTFRGTSAVAGAGTAAVRLRSSLQSSPAASGTAASRLRTPCSSTGSSSGVLTPRPPFRGTASAQGSGTAAVRLRTTMQATCRATGVMNSGVTVPASGVATGSATGTINGARLRTTFNSAGTGAGTAAPRLRTGFSCAGASTGAASARIRSTGTAVCASSCTSTGRRIRSTFSSGATGTATASCRIRSSFAGVGSGAGAAVARLRSGGLASGGASATALCRLRSTLLATGRATGVVNTNVTIPLSGTLSASASLADTLLRLALPLGATADLAGSVATAALPVAYRLQVSLSGDIAVSAGLGVAWSFTGTTALSLGAANTLGVRFPLQGTAGLTATPATSLLGLAVPLEGSLAVAGSLSGPELEVIPLTLKILNGSATASFVIASAALDIVRYPRSPPSRTTKVPARARTTIVKARDRTRLA